MVSKMTNKRKAETVVHLKDEISGPFANQFSHYEFGICIDNFKEKCLSVNSYSSVTKPQCSRAFYPIPFKIVFQSLRYEDEADKTKYKCKLTLKLLLENENCNVAYLWSASIYNREKWTRTFFFNVTNSCAEITLDEDKIVDLVMSNNKFLIYFHIEAQFYAKAENNKKQKLSDPIKENCNNEKTEETLNIEKEVNELLYQKEMSFLNELSFLKRQFKDFGKLLEDQSFFDVKLTVGDGKELNAQKLILSARSPVFKKMFQENGNLSIMEISEVDYETAKKMLTFIYVGEIEDFDHMAAENLLQLAERYAIAGLKEKCQQILCKNVSIDNALDYLILSDKWNAENLKEDSINIIIENFKIFRGSQFKKLNEANPNLLIDILDRHSMFDTKVSDIQ